MNTTAQALVFAVATVAVAALASTTLVDRAAAQPAMKIERLETVEVVIHRAAPQVAVVQLPRVVVIGHRQLETASADHADQNS